MVLTITFFHCNGFAEILSIKGDKVSLRSDPDQKSKSLCEYGDGFPVEVTKKNGKWFLVKDFENDSLKGQFLLLLYAIKTGVCNVRPPTTVDKYNYGTRS